MNLAAILNGGPCDGLVVPTSRDVILMPTDPRAAIGEIPPTAPHFAEYRDTLLIQPDQFGSPCRVFRFVGLGIDTAHEAATEQRMIEQ